MKIPKMLSKYLLKIMYQWNMMILYILIVKKMLDLRVKKDHLICVGNFDG